MKNNHMPFYIIEIVAFVALASVIILAGINDNSGAALRSLDRQTASSPDPISTQNYCSDSDGGVNFFERGITSLYDPYYREAYAAARVVSETDYGSSTSKTDSCFENINGEYFTTDVCYGAGCKFLEFYCQQDFKTKNWFIAQRPILFENSAYPYYEGACKDGEVIEEFFDLELVSITVSPPGIGTGDMGTITYSVRNNGNVGGYVTGGSGVVCPADPQIACGGSGWGAPPSPSNYIAPGGVKYYNEEFRPLTAGLWFANHSYHGIGLNGTEDLDPTNNNLYEEFTVVYKPYFDLAIVDANVSDYSPLVGENVTVDYYVKNIGTAAGFFSGDYLSIIKLGGSGGSGGGGPLGGLIKVGQTVIFSNIYSFNSEGTWRVTRGFFGTGMNGSNETYLENNYWETDFEVSEPQGGTCPVCTYSGNICPVEDQALAKNYYYDAPDYPWETCETVTCDAELECNAPRVVPACQVTTPIPGNNEYGICVESLDPVCAYAATYKFPAMYGWWKRGNMMDETASVYGYCSDDHDNDCDGYCDSDGCCSKFGFPDYTSCVSSGYSWLPPEPDC